MIVFAPVCIWYTYQFDISSIPRRAFSFLFYYWHFFLCWSTWSLCCCVVGDSHSLTQFLSFTAHGWCAHENLFLLLKKEPMAHRRSRSLSLWHLIVVVIGGGGVCCCYEFGRSNALLHRALVWIEHSYISWEQLIQLFSVRIVIDRSLKSKSVKNERNRSLFEASPSFISKWCQLFGVQCNGSDRNSSAFCGNFVRFRQHWFDCEMVQVNCTVYKL